MSHTLRKVNLGNTALVEASIIDYVAGGESFTLTELGLTGALVSVLFLAPALSPDLPLTPVLVANKVQLQYRPGIEIPATTALNYTFVAIVHGT